MRSSLWALLAVLGICAAGLHAQEIINDPPAPPTPPSSGAPSDASSGSPSDAYVPAPSGEYTAPSGAPVSAPAGDCGPGGCGPNGGGPGGCAKCGKHGCGKQGCGVKGCGAKGCNGSCKQCQPLGNCLRSNQLAYGRAQSSTWHGGFYDPAYGAPIALVVPPTVEYQTNYGWGVGNTRVSRIDHQFMRPYPGPPTQGRYGYGYGFAPTPPWPSDTMQFGVYYVRGPW